MVYKIPSYLISDFEIRLILLPKKGMGPLIVEDHFLPISNTDVSRYLLRFERSLSHCVRRRLPVRDVTGQAPEGFKEKHFLSLDPSRYQQ